MSSCSQVRTASCCYTLNRAAVLRSSNQSRPCQRSSRLLVLFCTHQRSMCLLALCLPQLEGPRGSFSSLSSLEGLRGRFSLLSPLEISGGPSSCLSPLRGQRSHFSHLSLMKESLQHLESADGSDSTQPPPVFPPAVSTLSPAASSSSGLAAATPSSGPVKVVKTTLTLTSVVLNVLLNTEQCSFARVFIENPTATNFLKCRPRCNKVSERSLRKMQIYAVCLIKMHLAKMKENIQ